MAGRNLTGTVTDMMTVPKLGQKQRLIAKARLGMVFKDILHLFTLRRKIPLLPVLQRGMQLFG